MAQRRILHADFNGFYASVACFLNPEIRGLPVAVAGDPELRHGIILAKNELAKKFGVKTGEAIWQARAKCPHLLCVKPDFPSYHKFSDLGRAIYGEYSDRVEAFGLDENWIDVTNSTKDFDEAERLAEILRLRIKEELGITVSIGVAENKVFAKLGSDMKKPDAVTVIRPDQVREKVWPLGVRELLYVGRATEKKLQRIGVFTIGDLAKTPETLLHAQLGKCGIMLHAFANGQDRSPVLQMGYEPEAKSVGNGITTPRDLETDDDVYLTLIMLSESVSARLRDAGTRAKVISIAVRDKELVTFSRQKRLSRASNLTSELAGAAMELFRTHYDWKIPVRSITVTASDLEHGDAPEQLDLFGDETRRRRAEQAEAAVDHIRRRFGYHAIGRAIFLTDDQIGTMNPKEENVVHPVGYLKNGSMMEVIGRT